MGFLIQLGLAAIGLYALIFLFGTVAAVFGSIGNVLVQPTRRPVSKPVSSVKLLAYGVVGGALFVFILLRLA